ncbi:aldo/keto reductase [Vibrio sp. 03-59-1]|uniref:aldo/keto reductase n=1 Tax=Vibrio sp. 03-59-1 TaxID=2607607 RepID=UPI0014933A05|nr:aldo/keto reductase [Vibrio sp. 03-59-1]NOH84522.1 aldo/keto reductase [Vibrio sp. 03-59-1]
MKEICLGTAMWGWSVDKITAFSILDCFYEYGGRYVDTANNYPLNGVASDYQKSIMYISDWCNSRDVSDLVITCKIGSVINSNTSENNLNSKFLYEQLNWLLGVFKSNLGCVMIHWDDRGDLLQIKDTLSISTLLLNEGIQLGLSGIKYPEVYASALHESNIIDVNIQVKHNFASSSFSHYSSLSIFKPKIWAYGISVSGLKLSESEYKDNSYVSLVRGSGYHRHLLTEDLCVALNEVILINDTIDNIYQIGVAYSQEDKALHGFIVAPSTLEQMFNITDFLKKSKFKVFDLSPIYSLEVK